MTATRVVPRCGRLGCDLDRTAPMHSHDRLEAGDVVVVEPKRPNAPGWTFSGPVGVVTASVRVADHIGIDLDDGRHVDVAGDLVTRWHTWRRRPHNAPAARTLPRLGRHHVIDPELDVVEPSLFGADL